MNRRIKAHPLMIGEKIKPFLFVLVLPLLKGLFQYIIQGRISGVLSLEIVAVALIAAITVALWLSFSLELLPDRIIIRSGVFLKRTSYIEFKNISSISFKQNPLDACFKTLTCYVNTEAGGVGKEDFAFKLRRQDAKLLKETVFGTEKLEKSRVSPLKIAFWAATTSSAFSGLIIGAPVVNKIGDLLGIALYGLLFDEITEVSSSFNTYMPPIVNTVTIIFIIAYGVGFLYHFVRNLSFSFKTGNSRIEVESGILLRRNTAFKRESVNNVSIEQTFLMRLAGRASMQAFVGGYGGNHSERAVLAPCERRSRLIGSFNKLFGFLDVKNQAIRPVRTKGNLRRFLWLPILTAVFILTFMLITVKLYPSFESFIMFVSALLLAADCYWADLCCFNYKRGKLSLGENICAVGSKRLKTAELYCEKTKIGSIKLRQTPADRRLGTCKAKMTVNSEKAYSIWVRNISKRAVLKNIAEVYQINFFE